MSFIKFTDLSQEHVDTDFQSIFSNTGLSGSTSLMSLSAESSEIARMVRYTLGEPILTVEIDNSQIDAAFERANLEYSRILSTMQIGNYFSTIMGLSREYSEHDLKNILPYETFSYIRRYSKNYGIFGPNPVGGNVDIRRGYVSLTGGTQDYNIYTNLYDQQTGQTLGEYVLSNSASPSSIVITKLYHEQPISMNRYFDPWNTQIMLSNDFRVESYTMESTQFYIMPVWNDILRGQVNRESDLVRKSNYSYNQIGNRLLLFPCPKDSNIRVYFEWFQDVNAFTSPNPFETSGLSAGLTANGGNFDSSLSGINAVWNVPMTDINYGEMNPAARQWIREFTVALCRELLGDIRSKYASIPLPNGDVTLNGNDLTQRGREDQTRLKEELRTDLDKFRKVNMLAEEAAMAQSTYDTLKFFPLPFIMG